MSDYIEGEFRFVTGNVESLNTLRDVKVGT